MTGLADPLMNLFLMSQSVSELTSVPLSLVFLMNANAAFIGIVHMGVLEIFFIVQNLFNCPFYLICSSSQNAYIFHTVDYNVMIP